MTGVSWRVLLCIANVSFQEVEKGRPGSYLAHCQRNKLAF